MHSDSRSDRKNRRDAPLSRRPPRVAALGLAWLVPVAKCLGLGRVDARGASCRAHALRAVRPSRRARSSRRCIRAGNIPSSGRSSSRSHKRLLASARPWRGERDGWRSRSCWRSSMRRARSSTARAAEAVRGLDGSRRSSRSLAAPLRVCAHFVPGSAVRPGARGHLPCLARLAACGRASPVRAEKRCSRAASRRSLFFLGGTTERCSGSGSPWIRAVDRERGASRRGTLARDARSGSFRCPSPALAWWFRWYRCRSARRSRTLTVPRPSQFLGGNL